MSTKKTQDAKSYFANVESFNLATVGKATQAQIKKIPSMIEVSKPTGTVYYYVCTKGQALLLLAGIDPVMAQDGEDGDGKDYISPILLSAERSITVTDKGRERIASGKSDKSQDRFDKLFNDLLATKALQTAFKARWRAIGNEIASDKAATAKRGKGRYEATQGHGMSWYGKNDITHEG